MKRALQILIFSISAAACYNSTGPEHETATNNNANSAESMTKSMTVVMPLFTLWITYTLPMAMGVYWVASNIFSLLQTIFLNGYYSKKFAGELEEIDDAQLAKQIEKHGDKRKKAKLIEKSKKDK